MTRTEVLRIQKYLNSKFESTKYSLKKSQSADDCMEIHFADEFVGMIYRDEDEGEVSYAVNLAILEMDLPNAADASLI
jgi:hypothetical protein